MLICKSKTWKFPLGARWWLNVNCLTFMFILLKVPLYVQTKLSVWLEEHITKWTEKSNHQYQGTSCLHGSWESKACRLLREVVSLSSKLQRKYYNQNQITVCLLGKNLKPVPFSLKLKMLDNSNTQVESHDVFALGLGVGVQRERAELQARGKHRSCNPSWAQAWLFLHGLLALPNPSFPLMQSKELHNGGKNKRVLVEAVTWGCAFAVNVSDIQGSGQPGSAGQQTALGQMNLSQDSRCTCSSLDASLCSLVPPNESFWDQHIMLRSLKTSRSLLHRKAFHSFSLNTPGVKYTVTFGILSQ